MMKNSVLIQFFTTFHAVDIIAERSRMSASRANSQFGLGCGFFSWPCKQVDSLLLDADLFNRSPGLEPDSDHNGDADHKKE
jgi:hypothetical protein